MKGNGSGSNHKEQWKKKKEKKVHSTLALRSLIIQHAASLWKKETDKSHMLIVGPLWLTFGSNIPYCD